jgi:SAM-dependent methyltransferase
MLSAEVRPEAGSAGQTTPAPCPVCRDGNPQTKWEVRGYRIGECRSCGHRFVAQSVSPAVLAATYGHEYYEGGAASGGYEDYLARIDARMAGFRERLDYVEKYLRPPASVLDVGCAVGLFLRVAEESGWTAMGVEHSAWAADYGRRTWGLVIWPDVSSASAARPTGFDVLTMWDVIEHLPNPREVLEQAHSTLRDGGYIALSTVNSSSLGAVLAGRGWRHVVPPLHLNYFTRASLFRLLRLTGFEPVFHCAEGVCLRAAAPTPPFEPLGSALESLLLHWRLRPLARALNLLDEVMVIARRVSHRPDRVQ